LLQVIMARVTVIITLPILQTCGNRWAKIICRMAEV